MTGILYGVVAWALSGAIPMMLVGAGLSIVTYSAISPLINQLLQQAVNYIGGLPEIALQLLLLAGVGESISILGSALLTRMAITFAANIGGLKVNSQ